MSEKVSDSALPGSGNRPSKTHNAGFWSLLLMVIGVQCGGMSTIWNLGAAEGLKKLLLAHALVGLMYVLLALCFAELTSVVPFAGGSFGFCRAALGPFWGFMVGASEVLENIMKVVVCVSMIAFSITFIFKTNQHLTPLWMFLIYAFLFGIHVRGGSLLWNTVILLGLISIGTVLMFCIGNTKNIDVKFYGQLDNSSFDGDDKAFLESFHLVIWVYIGIEIVPQTCERVKNVNTNLPRAMVLGTLISYGLIFWVIMAVTCNFPGYLYLPALVNNPFPFSIGFVQMFKTSDFLLYGPLFAIIPVFASALAFMWGCGYQVASLARSGLLPKVFATTFGDNETPIFALAVSSVIQLLMCVWAQQTNSAEGVQTFYSTMMIGATFVYIGMFASFIIFRLRFGGMKRHWVSPVGIPGAAIGIGLATILCIAVIILQARTKSLTTYFVFMGSASLYYFVYARHTQYFSAEEQKHFMKAYILNANHSKNAKGRSFSQSKLTETMFDSIYRMLSFRSSSERPSSQRSRGLESVNRQVGFVSFRMPMNKPNTVTPSSPAVAQSMRKAETAASVPATTSASEPLSGPEGNKTEKGAEEAVQEKLYSMSSTKSIRGVIALGGSVVGWSGKAMKMAESAKFLEVLATQKQPEEVAEVLLGELPNQFSPLDIENVSANGIGSFLA